MLSSSLPSFTSPCDDVTRERDLVQEEKRPNIEATETNAEQLAAFLHVTL